MDRREFLKTTAGAVAAGAAAPMVDTVAAQRRDGPLPRTAWAVKAITAAGHPEPVVYTRGPRDFERLCAEASRRGRCRSEAGRSRSPTSRAGRGGRCRSISSGPEV